MKFLFKLSLQLSIIYRVSGGWEGKYSLGDDILGMSKNWSKNF